MAHSVLIVDDEENILKSLSRLFRDEDFKTYTTLSGAGGLKIVEEHDISLIVSDYRMPEMDGVEFLSKTKEISPDTLRIMLTGYADLDAAVKAINEGEVYRFISKPWNDDELLFTIKTSLEYRDIIMSHRGLTKTVKKQAFMLDKLEKENPGITEVFKDDSGAIVIDESELEGFSPDDLDEN